MNRTECVSCVLRGRSYYSGPETGGTCEPCDRGSMPSEHLDSCTLCGRGRFSSSGEECIECRNTTIPNRLLGSWDCRTCAIGHAPNNETYQCDSCEMLGPLSVSPDGTSCHDCGVGFEPNSARSACSPCANGQYFSPFSHRCEHCPAGFELLQSNATAACVECGPGFYKPGLAGRCQFCGVGNEPNLERTSCLACENISHSTEGFECVDCPAGRVPNAERSSCASCAGSNYFDLQLDECSPCPDGTLFLIDNAEGTYPPCVSCPPGRAGVGGQCEECGGATEPDRDRTRCQQCSANQISIDGIECIPCGPGTRPNPQGQDGCIGCPPPQTTCEACPRGRYSTNGYSCSACFHHSHSERGARICECDTGFLFDNSTDPELYSESSPCVDIDECTDPQFRGNGSFAGHFEGGLLCDPMAVAPSCINLPGSYNCSRCPVGFEGTGSTRCFLPEVDPTLGEAAAEPQVTLTLSASTAVLEEGPAQEAYIAGLAADMAASLGVSLSEIEIGNLRSSNTGIEDSSGRRRLIDLSAAGEKYPRLPAGFDCTCDIAGSLEDIQNLPLHLKKKLNRLKIIHTSSLTRIEFRSETDVSTLDLIEQILFFEENNQFGIELYPNKATKPARGSELNKPAVITLVQHFDGTDAALRSLLNTDGEDPPMFVNYDRQTKELTLLVQHFTRYGIVKIDATSENSPRRLTETVDIQFDFILRTENPGEAASVLNDLNQQLQDPSAPIFHGNTTSALAVGQTAEVVMNCPEGSFRAEGESTCETCPVGYEPNEDQTGCNNCKLHDIETGLAWSSDGTGCHACPPGTAPDDLRGACLICPEHTYSTDGVECNRCVPSQMPNEDKTGCICAVGFYNATLGHIKCYLGSASFEESDFPAPEIMGVSTTADVCVECDEMCTNCKYGHAAIRTGFAVSMTKVESKNPLHKISGHRAVFSCPVWSACNVSYDYFDSDNGLNGTNWQQCTAAYTGPLCGVCARGFSRRGLAGKCTLCPDSAGINFLLAFATIAAGYFVFLWVAYLLVVAESDDPDVEKIGIARVAKQVMILSKITISLFQIIAQMQVSLDINYPDSFQWFVTVIRAFSFDFLSMLSVGCFSSFTFYDKFFFAVFLPLVMGVGCALVYEIKSRGKDDRGVAAARNVAVQMGFFIIFLVYPFVSQTVFTGFSCRRLADHESWLSADLQISCDTLGHVLYMAVAILAVGIYPVGVPIWTLFLLVKNRHDMKIENSPGRLRYAFLVADYKPEYYFWETLEMLRKVILTGLLIFFARGSVLQLVVGILITFCFLLGTARNMPYKSMTSNRFKLATESALMLTLIFAVLLKVDLSKEDIDETTIGVVMLFNNSVIPSMAIAASVLASLNQSTDDLDIGSIIQSTKQIMGSGEGTIDAGYTDNPLNQDSENEVD